MPRPLGLLLPTFPQVCCLAPLFFQAYSPPFSKLPIFFFFNIWDQTQDCTQTCKLPASVSRVLGYRPAWPLSPFHEQKALTPWRCFTSETQNSLPALAPHCSRLACGGTISPKFWCQVPTLASGGQQSQSCSVLLQVLPGLSTVPTFTGHLLCP